jgi:hypothetical protein
LSFSHEVIVLGRRDEYQVWATLLTAMTKDFGITAKFPPYEDMVASYLIRNCFGFDKPSYIGNVGDLYKGGQCVACSSGVSGEASSYRKSLKLNSS